MHCVTEAKYIKDYKISVVFDDNKSGIIDFKNIGIMKNL
jgi:hypothetical protein